MNLRMISDESVFHCVVQADLELTMKLRLAAIKFFSMSGAFLL
jgi:hypothetical protein